MAIDTRIRRHGKTVPVVAFFGVKGGVGKTTISRRFAELMTLAPAAPNVLLLDFDVYQPGMTVTIGSKIPVACKSVHDYIASQNTSDVEAAEVTGTVRGRKPGSGRLFFIPASAPEAKSVFEAGARIGGERMLQILHEVISSAVEQYGCECVVIDCGPIIDPYTASAATLADRAFVIGQNEPISFNNFKTYIERIREFHPEFSSAKMKIIINKVRGWEMLEQRKLQEDIFAAIPFTMDIVDVSEGLKSGENMQEMMFEDHITQILQKVFLDRPDLVPDRSSSLPEEWNSLLENAGQLERAPALKRLKMFRLLLPIGLLVMVAGGGIYYSASSQRLDDDNEARQEELASQETTGVGTLLLGALLVAGGLASARSRKNYMNAIQGLKRGGAEWLMGELKGKRSARKTFDRLLKISQA